MSTSRRERPRLLHWPGSSEACIRILKNEVQQQETAMKQAQPLGQNTDQARAVEFGEKAMRALQKAQENFEQAQQEVMPRQNWRCSSRTLEALTGIIENLWNPDAGQPPEHLIQKIQANSSDLFGSHVSGGWRGFGRRVLSPRDTELLALSQRACAIIPALASS